MATIVDGVRQKPTYETTGFATDQEVYLYNVGAEKFFTQGNSWATQASIGDEGRKVKFALNNGAYTMQCYCWRDANQQGGTMSAAWRNVFFDSETSLFVDRNKQSDYFFAVEQNDNGTFRLSTSSSNPTFADYAGAGLYVGLKKNSSSTVLSPFVDADEAYVDWALVSVENYDGLSAAIELYNKAQELKDQIDKIKAENGDASSLEAVYLNESATMAQLEAAITASKAIYIQALINNAPDKENVDVTLALANPDFEKGETGWTVVAASGSGYNGHQGNVRPGGSANNQCYEAWNNSAFDIYQTLSDMPVGVYEIEVQGFYRYGRDLNAWNAYTAQNVQYVKPEGVPVYIYLNNNATNFVNVFGDDKQITNESFYSTGSSDYQNFTGNGSTYYFPNGMASAAIAFSDGMYKQSAFGLIANEGDAFRIGVKGNSNQLNDSWVIWDNFKLYYRGFKAEVVQPVLETAIADLQQYSGMLMGKTEFAALSKALADASAAIEAKDGTAMFQALNAIYDVKESVIASKDLFLAEEVPAEVESLSACLTENANEKFYKTFREAAQTLLAGIQGNTLYEGSQIEQLKNDVSSAIANIGESLLRYAELYNNMAILQDTLGLKACSTVIEDATAALNAATTAYNEGTMNDSAANDEIELIIAKRKAVTASAKVYAQLNEAIASLQAAIAEASAETQHVAKSTLTKANLRLTASQKVYDEATTADADVSARVTTIGELITELTHSIELYKQFATALDELKAALDKEDKVNAAIRSTAQQTYESSLAAYNDGSIDDNQIEAQITTLQGEITKLENSAAQYATLAAAIPTLEDATGQKAQQSLLDEAGALLTSVQSGYEAASIADADIPAIIDQINTLSSQINTSATLYEDLAAAIGRLNAAITEYGDQITNSSLRKANLRLTASQRVYNEGSIAGADIPARVETIDQLIEDMTASIILRQQYESAIASLDAAVASAKDNVSETMYARATALQANIKTDYAEGNIDDDNITAEISRIEQIVSNLTAVPAYYQSITQAEQSLSTALQQLEAINDEVVTVWSVYGRSYVATRFKASLEDAHNDYVNNYYEAEKHTLSTDKPQRLAGLLNQLDAVDLTADLTATLQAIAQDIEACADNPLSSEGRANDIIRGVDDAITASQYIAELKGEYATFCSPVELDFTGVEGLKAYVATELDAETQTVVLSPVEIVPGGMGVVLVGEAGEYEIPAGIGGIVEQNLLSGTVVTTTLSKQTDEGANYILAAGQQGTGFYPVKDGSTLAAGKAYLTLPATAGEAKGWRLTFSDGGNATRIETISSETADTDVYYNLNGQRIQHPQTKGVYIKNGKKVFIK
jgi:hypothetical protein